MANVRKTARRAASKYADFAARSPAGKIAGGVARSVRASKGGIDATPLKDELKALGIKSAEGLRKFFGDPKAIASVAAGTTVPMSLARDMAIKKAMHGGGGMTEPQALKKLKSMSDADFNAFLKRTPQRTQMMVRSGLVDWKEVLPGWLIKIGVK